MDDARAFGTWLQRQRKTLDLTQAALAGRVGCAVGTIRKLESAERRPSRALVARLLQVLGVPEQEYAAVMHVARSFTSVSQLGDVPSLSILAHADEQRIMSLPAPLTPLIDRVHEMLTVEHLLRGDEARLVTLVGPPGVGKTRLSLEIAAHLHPCFPDGTMFVALAPITEPTLVVATIAHALGIVDAAEHMLLDRLKRALRSRRILLLLDNFEHVVAAAPIVTELLATAPHLKVLVTSRVPLHVYGEHQVLVPLLALPDLPDVPPIEELRTYAAVRLFVTRAQAVQPNFRLTTENAAPVAALCGRLDGLPLAIELAAAWMKHVTPTALLARVEQAACGGALAVLTTGARNLPARHRTLRNAIAWSYDLLRPEEQQLFRCLGVFADGWTLDAATKVCSGDQASDAVERDLHALLDTSLLWRTVMSNGQARYGMLTTIRAFALEQLHHSGEVARIQLTFAAYYLDLAEQAAPHLHCANQQAWLRRLACEHNNLRAVLQTSLMLDGMAMVGLQLAVAVWRFWAIQGHWHEGHQ